MLGFAIANLGISAPEFWRMTMREFAAAHKAWMRMQGFDETEKPEIDRNDLADLFAGYE